MTCNRAVVQSPPPLVRCHTCDLLYACSWLHCPACEVTGEERVLTMFEREIDAVSAFKPAEVVSYRPVEQFCSCGRKHFGLSTICSWCACSK